MPGESACEYNSTFADSWHEHEKYAKTFMKGWEVR